MFNIIKHNYSSLTQLKPYQKRSTPRILNNCRSFQAQQHVTANGANQQLIQFNLKEEQKQNFNFDLIRENNDDDDDDDDDFTPKIILEQFKDEKKTARNNKRYVEIQKQKSYEIQSTMRRNESEAQIIKNKFIRQNNSFQNCCLPQLPKQQYNTNQIIIFSIIPIEPDYFKIEELDYYCLIGQKQRQRSINNSQLRIQIQYWFSNQKQYVTNTTKADKLFKNKQSGLKSILKSTDSRNVKFDGKYVQKKSKSLMIIIICQEINKRR